MSLATLTFQRSGALVQESTKVVVVCEQLQDRAAQQIIGALSSFAGLELHVIELQAPKGGHSALGRVHCSLTSAGQRATASPLAESQAVDEVWNMSWPGAVHERIIRYCHRTAAELVIVPENINGQKRIWWREALAEKLARYVPVLSLPAQMNYQELMGSQRPLRWVVALDGTIAAEQVLGPLRSIMRWLPSEVLLIQPLDYAQLNRHRVASHKSASIARMGVSIADSTDYLQRIAQRHLPGVSTRVCCLNDSNSSAALIRAINSPAFGAVALGLSNQWRIIRRFRGEFNETIFNKVEKPRLLYSVSPI
jgi:hypothetical protein